MLFCIADPLLLLLPQPAAAKASKTTVIASPARPTRRFHGLLMLLLLFPRLDCVGVFRAPGEADPPATGLECLAGRGFEVLTNHHQDSALVELDRIPGDHPDVDHVADPAGLRVHPGLGRVALVEDVDLLRTDRKAARLTVQGTLEHVRDADEAG